MNSETIKYIFQSTFQILVLSFVIYWFLRELKGTVVPMVIYTSIFILGGFYLFCSALDLQVLKWTLGKFFIMLPVLIVVLMKEELRKMIGTLKSTISGGWAPVRSSSILTEEQVEELCSEIMKMSLEKTGALIAIEQNMSLENYLENAKMVNVELKKNSCTLESIFHKGGPLHDGGVIIRRGYIVGASCVFPVSTKEEVKDNYGLRHRAAFGISERTDALVIVVSEENGEVLVIKNDRGFEIDSKQRLSGVLQQYLTYGEARDPFWVQWFKKTKTRFRAYMSVLKKKKKNAEENAEESR